MYTRRPDQFCGLVKRILININTKEITMNHKGTITNDKLEKFKLNDAQPVALGCSLKRFTKLQFETVVKGK